MARHGAGGRGRPGEADPHPPGPEPSARRKAGPESAPARRAGGGLREGALADLCLFPALKPVATALHGGGELLEVDLERVEDVVGVVLGAEPDLALAGAGVLD